MTEIRRVRKAEVNQQRKLFPIRLADTEVLKAWECFDADSGKDLAVKVREHFIPGFSHWESDQASCQQSFDRLLWNLAAKA